MASMGFAAQAQQSPLELMQYPDEPAIIRYSFDKSMTPEKLADHITFTADSSRMVRGDANEIRAYGNGKVMVGFARKQDAVRLRKDINEAADRQPMAAQAATNYRWREWSLITWTLLSPT